MKTKELRERIKDAGGKVTLPHDVNITYDLKDDIDIKVGDTLIAWIKVSSEGDEEVEAGVSMWSEAIRHIGALCSVAQYLGIPVEGVQPITIEKTVVVPDMKVSTDLSRVQSDWQRSENERGAEKRAYQWVVGELADKLRN